MNAYQQEHIYHSFLVDMSTSICSIDPWSSLASVLEQCLTVEVIIK